MLYEWRTTNDKSNLPAYYITIKLNQHTLHKKKQNQHAAVRHTEKRYEKANAKIKQDNRRDRNAGCKLKHGRIDRAGEEKKKR